MLGFERDRTYSFKDAWFHSSLVFQQQKACSGKDKNGVPKTEAKICSKFKGEIKDVILIKYDLIKLGRY